MKKHYFYTIFSVLVAMLSISCSVVDKGDQNVLSTALDTEFINSENTFTIKPPLDWKVKQDDTDCIFTPDVAELETRNAKAKIVVQYIKLDSMMNPNEFRDFIEFQIEKAENVREFEILEYGGTPSDAYCNILVRYDSSVGRSTHYFRNILSGSGYYRVSGSALTKHWEIVAPLLKASIATFKIK